MIIQFPFKRNNWIFHTGSWFPSFVSWKTYPYVWTFWLRNFQQSWSIFQCYLDIYRYCIRSLSFTICEFCNYIHDFRRSHLWRRRFLLCEYSISVWVIFYNVITEFHTSFVLLKFLLQLSIFQVTHVHHWSKVDFSFVSLCLQDDLFLASDLSWIDWYFHSDLFFPVHDSFITDTDLDSSFLDLTEWENTLVIETLSRSRCQKHFLLEPNTVGTVQAADLRLLLLDFWCGICSETLSDALSW